MREIIFRGKRIDNGELVYGDLTQDRDLETAYIQGHDYYTDDCGPQREPFCCDVDPETVGQYTERKDKTGIRIFEGDIVKIDSFIYQVEFRYSEWEFRILSKKVYCFPNFDSHTGECEIIGNIHDNPELLEVQP